MKIIIPFLRSSIVFFTCSTVFIITGFGQTKGILPLTGMKYFNEGLSAKSLNVKIDGAQILSNRIPLNKEIEISLQQTNGFAADNKKIAFAGAEVIVLSAKGEVLSNEPNVLAKNLATGFTAKDLNNLNIKFTVLAAMMKTNLNAVVKIRLYDLKGKSQMRLEMPVTFTRYGERLQVSKTVKAIKSTDAVNGMINGLQAKNMQVMVDTSIKVAPKMAYTSMNISRIEGSSIGGIFEGKENFWVYDSDLNEVKISDILLKQVKGAMENEMVDYTLKIPYRLKAKPVKLYTVRFRWESPDKTQVIDIVVVI
jgi:hypothetical protein